MSPLPRIMNKVDRMALAEKMASESCNGNGDGERIDDTDTDTEHVLDRGPQKDLSLKTGVKIVLNLGSRPVTSANSKPERELVASSLSSVAAKTGARGFLPPPPPPGTIVKPTRADIINHDISRNNSDSNSTSISNAVENCDESDDWNDFQSSS